MKRFLFLLIFLAFSGDAIAQGVSNQVLNSITRFDVSNYAGIDAGAKMTACLAALPATGGICDARALQGAQSGSVTVVVPQNKTLLLGNITFLGSGNPGFSLVTGSKVIGIGRGASNDLTKVRTGTTAFGNANGSVAANFAEVSALTVQIEAASAVALNLVNMSFGTFNRIAVSSNNGLTAAGTYGIKVDGNGLCSCFNLFENNNIGNTNIGYFITAGGNSNTIINNEIARNNTGIDFGTGNGNAVIHSDFEITATNDVIFDATTVGNVMVAPRFEEVNANTGITTMVVNNSALVNSIIDAEDIGTGVGAWTDNTGALKYTSIYTGKNTPARTLNYTVAIPTTGQTVVISDADSIAPIVPGGTLATLTIQLPTCSAIYNGKTVTFSSSQTITTLTNVTATAGSVLAAPSKPTTLAPGVGVQYLCRGADTTWYRIL